MKSLLLFAFASTLVGSIYFSERASVLELGQLPEPVVDTDYYFDGAPSKGMVDLGRFLFFDKILSGNQNISCATCHHPKLASGDALALPLGEGPSGIGEQRASGSAKAEAVHERVPRNSPPLFNLGATEFVRMFHDGRVETDPNGYYEGGFISPAKWKLPNGLDNVLAVQAMFPPTSPAEMAGQKGENSVAEARSLNNNAGPGGVWQQLADRLRAIPEYVDLFEAAFPEDVSSPDDITMVLAANAIAAFETKAFRADNSPYDNLLRQGTRLDENAMRGMELFYGKASCSSCHSGKFQTDHEFHAIAMPQIGPGKADGNDPSYWRASGMKAYLEDFGRGRVTVRSEDNFKFRTPTLRNVAETGPWGHDGAYTSLRDVVRHHLNPIESLDAYSSSDMDLAKLDALLETTADGPRIDQEWLSERRLESFEMRDSWVQNNENLRARIADANELDEVDLSSSEIDDLVSFLESLTDPASLDLVEEIPDRVPSGLPIDN